MEKPTEISSSKMFEGYNKRYKHFSPTLGCSMTFSIYFPPSPSPSQKIPVLYWLSGLTCTDENFIIKSGAQRAASAQGIALIAPDTSPRGLNVEGEADSWDFGVGEAAVSKGGPCCKTLKARLASGKLTVFSYAIQAHAAKDRSPNSSVERAILNEEVGAGFYLNAKAEKWKSWRMYDYVVKELPKVLSENFEQLDTSRASISGHSMGGHGALTIYLKNLDKYKSASAFAPIVNPTNCPWGQKAFSNYLGDNKSDWEEYDATCLIAAYSKISTPILIDQGLDDKFLPDQLLASNFEKACKSVGAPLILRMQPGYDHSYYFISTFIDDHIRHHAEVLKSP